MRQEGVAMAKEDKPNREGGDGTSGRRTFLFAGLGGVIAAIAGWIAGAFLREASRPVEEPTPDGLPEPTISALEARIAELSGLEAKVGQLLQQLETVPASSQFAQLEGEQGERVVFRKSELTVTNPEGVLLNLVATRGHVGIRFYKDFDFGNEQVTNPWHVGYIEGIEGYEGLAILRDWRFTAALWDADGRLLLGSLHPHPPANDPPGARVHVRGTLDEVQTIVEGSPSQTADIFQVLGGRKTRDFAIDSAGNAVVGSSHDPRGIVLHDTRTGVAYSLKVTNGQLVVARV